MQWSLKKCTSTIKVSLKQSIWPYISFLKINNSFVRETLFTNNNNNTLGCIKSWASFMHFYIVFDDKKYNFCFYAKQTLHVLLSTQVYQLFTTKAGLCNLIMAHFLMEHSRTMTALLQWLFQWVRMRPFHLLLSPTTKTQS